MKAEYYQLGIALGLRPSTMKAIQRQNPSDIQQAFNDMLYAWLRWEHNYEQYGPPTWRTLAKAVDKFHHALAVAIARKHPLVGKNIYSPLILIITPRACARGKAIGLSVCRHWRRQHENYQISRCRHVSKL